MSHVLLNQYVASGTAAERGAFTPDPAAPPAGPAHGLFWYETDTGKLYAWDGADWDHVATAGGGGGADVTGPASSTDKGIARYSGTSGKVLQDTPGPTLEDSGRISNMVDPSSAQDAATKAYVDSIAANLGKRARVRVATTSAITIASDLNAGDSIDGVALSAGDWVLVKNQAAPEENGVYVAGVSPARVAEFDAFDEHPGSLVAVQEGTAQADTIWLCTSNVGGVLGTNAIVFSQLAATGDVVGPASSTNHAIARWDGTTGKLLQDSPGSDLDDAGRLTVKALHIPPMHHGASGAAITIDFDDSNEHSFELDDDAAVTLDNPRDFGRYVIVAGSGAGGFTPTWPANVRWVDAPPDFTDADVWFLITLLYHDAEDRFMASHNGPFDFS